MGSGSYASNTPAMRKGYTVKAIIRKTPVTDAHATIYPIRSSRREWVQAKTCRALERQRNEARAALREAMECMLAGHGWAQHLERWSRIANTPATGKGG